MRFLLPALLRLASALESVTQWLESLSSRIREFCWAHTERSEAASRLGPLFTQEAMGVLEREIKRGEEGRAETWADFMSNKPYLSVSKTIRFVEAKQPLKRTRRGKHE